MRRVNKKAHLEDQPDERVHLLPRAGIGHEDEEKQRRFELWGVEA
jgi:hypothetical protein